ncbi:MAG: ketosteroid isomerase-related protein [Pikeienuella sp.]
MSVELIRDYYDAFNRGDVDGMMDCLADDVRHDVNQGGARHGKIAFAEFCAHMARTYREQLTDMVIMATPDGKHAAAEFVVNGEYLQTDEGLPEADGQTYKLPAGGFFDINNGLITRVTTYYNLTDWMAQVAGEG